jgi:hypothetical protein
LNIFTERKGFIIMEYENKHEFASKGVAGAGLGLGIAGTALGLLNGGLGNILGGGKNNCGTGELLGMLGVLGGINNSRGGCSEDHFVNRYELAQQNEITNKDMEIAYLRGRDAAKTDSLELYKYVDGRFRNVESELANQAVKNAQIEGTFAVLGEQNKALRNEFMCALSRERDERCCGDNSIINYVNATFYPKLVADVTVGTTTTAQTLYNPLPNCGCGCNH